MPEKKIVDDYYSQINPSSDDSSKNASTKKPIIVAKKKIIVKKPKVTPVIEATSSSWDIKNTDTSKKPVIWKNFSKPKWFVQKIEVVKRNNDWWPKKEWARVDNKPRKFTIIKRWDPDFVDRSNKRTTGSSVDSDWVKFKLRSNTDIQSKTFTNNKKAVRWSNFDDNRKSKLASGDRKTRWRFSFVKDEDLTFTRSNKVNKKEEKNIEDIKQNLVERKWETVLVSEFLTLKELSEKIWVVLPMLMAEFMKNGMMVNINQKLILIQRLL